MKMFRARIQSSLSIPEVKEPRLLTKVPSRIVKTNPAANGVKWGKAMDQTVL